MVFTSSSAVGLVLFALVSTASARLLTVNLQSAGNFAVLTKTGVSTVPTSVITGNVGVYPITFAAMTGFSITRPSTDAATSDQVTGFLYGNGMTGTTPSMMATAIADMETAYTAAVSIGPPDYIDHNTGELGGQIITAGLYKFGTVVTISNDCTLHGTADDTWIFQIAGTLSILPGKKIILTGGAVAKNIVWVPSGATSFGTTSHFEGVVLGKTSASFLTGSTINGRVLMQTRADFQMTTVTPTQSKYRYS